MTKNTLLFMRAGFLTISHGSSSVHVLLGSTCGRHNRRVRIQRMSVYGLMTAVKMKQMQLLCYKCTLVETKRAGRIVQGSAPGLQGDVSRSASTQRLTPISGRGAFYTLKLAGNRTRGCDITTSDI